MRTFVGRVQELRELRAAGITLVLTTHAMDEAEALADSVYILDRGQVTVSARYHPG